MPRDHPPFLRFARTPLPTQLLLLLLALLTGCDDGGTPTAPPSDERLLQLSQQSLERQAEQSSQIARQSQAVIEASSELVEADAQARQELIGVHHDLQTERQGLDSQRADLVAEQRLIAEQRYRDPLIARTLETLGWIAVALLPLWVALRLLRAVGPAAADLDRVEEGVTELLVQELATSPTWLLPGAGLAPDTLVNLPEPATGRHLPAPAPAGAPLWVVVEGRHDAEFLRRISRILHAADPAIPDLGPADQTQQLVFVPAGGDHAADWAPQLSRRTGRSFHLYDREQGEQTVARAALVARLNAEPGCRACLTHKRSLENYLHPEAIRAARGIEVVIDDDTLVAETVAIADLGPAAWAGLSPRARRRARQQTQKWLNTDAVDRMTAALLEARDPDGELRGWLCTIAQLVEGR
jgi:hypothetical protein